VINMNWENELKKASKEVEIVTKVINFFWNTSPTVLVEMLFGKVYGGYDQEWISRYKQGFNVFWGYLDDSNRQKFVDAAMEQYG